jgi:hypothetical protein
MARDVIGSIAVLTFHGCDDTEDGPTVDIARISYVELRQVWPNEARDLTPWLLSNSDVLADALGVELEIEEAEHPVGGFSLDLLGRDHTHGCVLIVENQVEQTDHGHLGQLLTYASGTDAGTVVWIARDFRDEHRQALDWLNEHTGEDVRFFGVALRAIRIADSPPAPLLEVVAKPNDWQKRVRATTSGGDREGAYQQFWTTFLAALRERRPDLLPTRSSAPTTSYVGLQMILTGCRVFVAMGPGHVRVELYIDTEDRQRNREILDAFAAHGPELGAAVGLPVEFDRVETRQACKVLVRREAPATPILTPDAHDELRDWMLEVTARFVPALKTVASGLALS